jgi:iron complex outermembrane recepter protein
MFRLHTAASTCAVAVLSLTAPAFAATSATFTVRDTESVPLVGATVVVDEIAKECVTDGAGTCRIEGIDPGRYHVLARIPGFAWSRTEIEVKDGLSAAFELSMNQAVHVTESITVSPTARDTFESYQPTTVLGAEELQQRLGATLGATLGSEPGVNIRSFGPGNARPVIRGLDGDRVLVLENGVRTGDLSFQSGDHGVTLDPSTANQIEVVRGPATLLYGANAIGGVVNVVSDEIPRKPIGGLHGYLNGQAGTGNGEGGGSANVVYGQNGFAFRAQGTARRTGDYETPEGTVPNSQSDMVSGGTSIGYADDKGFLGAAYNYNRTRYGIPFVEEGNITLNPRRHRVDLRGERRFDGSFVEGIKFEGGYRNYKHTEFEGDEVGTQFFNKLWDGQFALNHRPVAGLKGTIGVEGTNRDYESIGQEALAPPTSQRSFSAYLYEEAPFHHLTLQFGARVDHTNFNTDPAAVPDREGIVDRKFTNVSGSVGLLGYLREDVTLALSLARAARNPSLEELYNVGAHPGNNAFEIGDPALDTEVGYGADLSLRWRRPRFTGEITVFRNDVDGYIFPFQTGEIEDQLPVIRFASTDARLQGFEAHADVALTNALWLELGGDGVRGELRDSDDALPRMPPYRIWAGLRYENKGFHLEGEVRAAARQDRVYGEEQPTAGYAVVNLHGSYTLTTGATAHTLTVRLDNANDRLYRNHLSYLKELAPEMGRSFRVVYGVRF